MESSCCRWLYFVVLVVRQRLERDGLAALVASADTECRQCRPTLGFAFVFAVAVPRGRPLDCSTECRQICRSGAGGPESTSAWPSDGGDCSVGAAADTSRRVGSSCKLAVRLAVTAIVLRGRAVPFVSEIVAGFAAVVVAVAAAFEGAQR